MAYCVGFVHFYIYLRCSYALENISQLLEFKSVPMKDNTDYSRRTIRNTEIDMLGSDFVET